MTMTFEQMQEVLSSITQANRDLQEREVKTEAIVEEHSKWFVETKALVDSNAKSIQAISNDLAELGRTVRESRLDFSETRAIVDSNARAIQAGSNETASLKEAARSLFASQERLTTAYIGFTDTVAQYIERTDRRLARLESSSG